MPEFLDGVSCPQVCGRVSVPAGLSAGSRLWLCPCWGSCMGWLRSRPLGFPVPVRNPSPHGTKGEGIQLLASGHPFGPWGAEPKCKLRSPSVKPPWWAQMGLQGQAEQNCRPLPAGPDTGAAVGVGTPPRTI